MLKRTIPCLIATVITLLTSTFANTYDLFEDYNTPPAQTGQYAGTIYDGDDDDYEGIFDDPCEPNDLRVTWGEGGADGIDLIDANGNKFVKVYADANGASDEPGFRGFIGILDHPTVEDFGYNLVGDFAPLYDEPVYVGGAGISIDVNLPSDPGFGVYIRFLFTDIDGDEFVTGNFQVSLSGWQRISVEEIAWENLILLSCDEGDGIWDGHTVFPVSVEVLVDYPQPYPSPVIIDFDNFHLVQNCKGRIIGDINHDCQVNFVDLALLASNWLESNFE